MTAFTRELSFFIYKVMKYNILINQKAVIDLGLNVDFEDVAIFDCIAAMINCSKLMHTEKEGVQYTYISTKLISKQLPLLRVTERTIKRKIDNLINAGLLRKWVNKEEGNVTLYAPGKYFYNMFFDNIEGGDTCTQNSTRDEKNAQGSDKKGTSYGQETTNPCTSQGTTLIPKMSDNNIIDNNIINNNTIDNNKENDAAKNLPASPSYSQREFVTLFRNSSIYKLVENNDYSRFEAIFDTPEFKDIDLVYYFHAVNDWSEQSQKKRTARGWIATVRNFIRSDKERGKLHTKPQNQKVFGMDVSAAIRYLKGDY